MRRAALHLLACACLIAPLAGCPAFWVERGELVRPSASLVQPAVSALPKSDVYVGLAEQWTRRTRIGLGGHVEATLLDPRLTAAELAHQAAIETMRPEALAAALATAWETRYGHERDRFAIDVTWRFDAQFISKGAVLEPANWQIALATSQGQRLAPLETSVLAASAAPRDGYWEGRVRLWFPYRDAERRRVLGAETDWVALELKHPSGDGALTWRFASVY